jgi:peptidyl-tRNA hydrolase
MDPAAYVLQNFNNQERDLVDATLERAVKAARTFLDNGFEAAMNQFNGGLKEG